MNSYMKFGVPKTEYKSTHCAAVAPLLLATAESICNKRQSCIGVADVIFVVSACDSSHKYILQ